MPQVAILNFSLVDSEPRSDGSQVVAGFDANAAGFRLCGCVILQRPDGSLVASPPEAKSRRYNHRAIKITDAELSREFNRRAIEAYEAMTR